MVDYLGEFAPQANCQSDDHNPANEANQVEEKIPDYEASENEDDEIIMSYYLDEEETKKAHKKF